MNYNRLLEPLRRRIATLINRAILDRANSGPNCQTVDVVILADEHQTGVEHMEPYGYTSNPPAGAEGLIFGVAGQRAAAVGINFGNRQFRLAGLKTGEVAMFTDEGDTLVFSRENTVTLTTKHFIVDAAEDVAINTKACTVNTETYTVNASDGVTYNTPSYVLGGGEGGCAAAITGDVNQTGSITSSGDHVAGGVSQIGHGHTQVQPGGGVSGPPQR